MKEKTISIHSSRGGTGKTLIASNLATIYAREGLNVALLDLDFRAPSIYAIFSQYERSLTESWLNDFLDNRCHAEQVLIDVTEKLNLKGRLLVGLANPSIAAIRGMMEKSRAWEVSAVKKIFSLLYTLFNKLDIDYCILDTSPGIHYASVNAVVSSDISVIVTTLDSIDVKGVENMLSELFDALAKKPLILINKAFPETRRQSAEKRNELIGQLEKTVKHEVIGEIPCYCDVLQAKRTSLLAIENPNHKFVGDLEKIGKKLKYFIEKG